MAFELSVKQLLTFQGEPGFWQAVVEEKQGWQSRATHVQEAIYRNALNTEHKDQWLWMQRFERMTGLKFLPEPEDGGLDLGR